jgi:uncharacterized protein YjbI with pentapeptide repeats
VLSCQTTVCLDGANLFNVDLRDAFLDGATFEGAILEETIFPSRHQNLDSSSGSKDDSVEDYEGDGFREDYMRDSGEY